MIRERRSTIDCLPFTFDSFDLRVEWTVPAHIGRSDVPTAMQGPLVGVLALQGAFEEHQKCLEAVGCRTVQVGRSE
jgi:hypothetical protein